MCIAAAGAIFSLLGTVVGAIGQMQQMKAQAAMADYQAAVDRNNKIIAERFAKDARARGSEAEARKRLEVKALLGKQRAVMASRNLALDSGSPLDILADTAQLGELDALTTRTNYERDAIGFEAQGMNYAAQAELRSMEADSLRQAAPLMMFGTILGGIGQLA